MSIKDFGNLMKQAQAMQERMQEMQANFAKTIVMGEAGAGLVKVEMNGRHEVLRVSIDPSLFTGLATGDGSEQEVVEDLIAAACNDAVRKVEDKQKEQMSSMAENLGLPLGKMPF